jgi:fatty-acyl-CoA synthase
VATTLIELFESSSSTLVFDDGRELAAAELARDARWIANWLAANGAGPGDRFGIRMPNQVDAVRLLLAAATGRAVAVAVNTRYSDDEADDLARRSGATTTVGPGRLGDLHDGGPIDVIGRRDDPLVVFTTSGTTSKPKMVLHTQRSIVEHAEDVAAGFGYRPDDVVMVAMPLCGTFGLTSLTGAVAGGSRVVVTDFEVGRTADLIRTERVTCVNGSDDLFHRLLEHGSDLSTIRLGGYARFNTSLDGVVDRAARAGATLTGLYGMSEVQALFALRDPAGDTADRARAGGTLVSSRADVRVVDGELQVRGPSLFTGYLAEGGAHVDAELTDRHLVDGWFRTGDLADPEGLRTFEYLARIGDAMRLGGFLVSPTEIEAVLMEFDGIKAAQVVAVDRPGGARPVAFVIAAGGTLDESAMIGRCRDRLARYKVPVRVITIDQFPTTPSANGTKIQKVRLRELAAAALQD